MLASEILELAARAGVGPDVAVLDLCCGVAGPGRLITAGLGCDYLGVDVDAGAVELARARATDLSCRFEVRAVPPAPTGSFDVVLLLETMLAFPDKEELLAHVAGSLVPGGRFAFTVEEGAPLTPAERAGMPAADTVWPVPLDELVQVLARVGLEVRWMQDRTDSHRRVADSLLGAFLRAGAEVAAELGDGPVDDLVAAHRLWVEWMAADRIRKLAVVAVKNGSSPA